MEKSSDIHELFGRYRSGHGSPDEDMQLLELIRSGKQQESIQALIAESLASPDRDGTISDEAIVQVVDAVYLEIQQLITPDAPAETMAATPHRGRMYRWLGRAAAATIITAMGCWGIVEYIDQPKLVTLSVPYGKTYTVILPDSSTVALNAGSTIRYRKPFEDKRRRVVLTKGQAFFDVRWNPDYPFVVEAGDLDVTVLGTSFEVKTFADDVESLVKVFTGKVSVAIRDGLAGSAEVRILEPNQQLVYNHQLVNTTLRTVPADTSGAWRKNQLRYTGERLDDILRSLERKYKTPIRLDNPQLAHQRITGVLGDVSLSNVLDVLSAATPFRYRYEQDTVVIR